MTIDEFIKHPALVELILFDLYKCYAQITNQLWIPVNPIADFLAASFGLKSRSEVSLIFEVAFSRKFSSEAEHKIMFGFDSKELDKWFELPESDRLIVFRQAFYIFRFAN